jgi:hypothetical protein
MARGNPLEETLKSMQRLKRYQTEAKKLADKAERHGLNVERFREDMGVNEVIEIDNGTPPLLDRKFKK